MNEEGAWVLIGLEDKIARKQGVPARLPVPRSEFEAIAEKGMDAVRVRKWVRDFLSNSNASKNPAWTRENAELVASYELFLSKADMWIKAEAAFAQNDYKKAIASLRLITKVDPSDHSAKRNLASALANTGDFPGAKASFEAVAETFDDEPDFHLAYGQVLIAVDQPQAGAEAVARCLELDPTNKSAMDLLVRLGVLLPVYEDPRDARSLTYVRADAVLPAMREFWDSEARTPEFYLEQLAYHETEGRHDVVLDAAERLVGVLGTAGSPSTIERATMARVGALRGMGMAAAAEATANEFVVANPGSAWAHVEVARCSFDRNDPEGGTRSLDRALEIDPGDQAALHMRFMPRDMTDIGKVHAGAAMLADFARAHESSPGVWRSLARAKAAIGLDDESASLFAKAVGLAPDDDEARAEYWGDLARQRRYAEILTDAAAVSDMPKRDWRLRWSEAEAYRGVGKSMEARAIYTGLNHDETLHVDVRKRAKRAVERLNNA